VLVIVGGIAVFAMGVGARHIFETSKERPLVAKAPGEAVVVAVPADAQLIDAAPARVEHDVYRFVDNRHSAHRFVGGAPVLDGGDVGFARHMRFGLPIPRWHVGHIRGGERAAIAERVAMIEVPLSMEHAKWVTQLTARVHGAEGHKLQLKVNGRKSADKAGKTEPSRVTLADGWQTITIPIAPGRLVDGENILVFETTGAKGTVAFQWLTMGPGDVPDDPRTAAAFDAKTEAITLNDGASLVWYVTVPDGAHFTASTSGKCKIEVRARASDGAFVGGNITADTSRIDLSSMAGRVVAFAMTTRECERATIAQPRITMHGPAPAERPKAEPPRYIVLWVMDALRADKVPIFQPGARAQTPNFDELAKSSVVFRQYYVQGNESQTSHSSVWTGLYPAVHNVRLAGVGGSYKIDAKFDVIAAQLAKAGMTTTAVTGNGFVNESGGYARGFKEFRNMMREKGVINGVIYGNQIVDAALGQLDKHRADPTYLFFGTIDTHGPWIARKPWIDIYSPGPYKGPFKEYGTAKDLGFRPGRMGCSIIPPKEDIERLRAIYDSAISYQDREIGRFIEQLKSWGIWDQTMLLITADHGEEFFEDTRCGHGGSLRDSLIRVPLLVHYPAQFPGGTIVDEGAEGVDIMPTMLDAIGAPQVEAAQGRSLIPSAQGARRGWATPSYTSMYEYAHAMRIGRWKIRVGITGTPVIGDMVEDPDEKKDRAGVNPVERRMLTDNLGLFLGLRKQWKKRDWGDTTNVTAAGAAALDEARTP
jgi:arylsulfatase A-like enzyme